MAHLKVGKVQMYAGDGKGKSTAACGQAVRAVGRGYKVRYCQFLKSGKSGELNILRELPGVEVRSGQSIVKFSFQMDDEEKAQTAKEMAQRLEDAFQNLEDVDLLVFDEALGAITVGFINEDRLIELIKNRPPYVEVVLTGRGPSQKLIDVADYYSEVVMRKHPYETEQLEARHGIEF